MASDLLAICIRDNDWMGFYQLCTVTLKTRNLQAFYAQGWTALLISSWYGRTRMVRLLVQRGVPVNQSDQQGQSAVFMAAQQGHVCTIRALAELKADINKPSKHGATPILVASQDGHTAQPLFVRWQN